MPSTPSRLVHASLLSGLMLLPAAPLSAFSRSSSVPVEVSSIVTRTSPDYQRKRQANGAFAREYYALSNAGAASGSVQDPTVREVPFPELAGALAQHLGRQNYFLANNARDANILLVVHWGTTMAGLHGGYTGAIDQASTAASGIAHLNPSQGFVRPIDRVAERAARGAGDPEADANIDALESAHESAMMVLHMQNRQRDMVNQQNARLLGYIDEINDRDGIQRWAGGGQSYDDLIGDIEEPRYYINVSAYDFRRATERGERKLLWTTKISLRYRGNRFTERFNDMLAAAAPYYGQHHRELIRRDLREVRVEIGEAEVVGVTPATNRR
jgi:hypothetical protein